MSTKDDWCVGAIPTYKVYQIYDILVLLQDRHFILPVFSIINLWLFATALSCSGTDVPVQAVSRGRSMDQLMSVNGSDINMGCASPLVDRGGVKICDNSESYLVDGCSPSINTSTSNWTSQLVTLRKVSDHDEIHFDQVLLTFGFNTAVSLTAIELDLFLCPEWNIGAPSISVSASNNNDLTFSFDFEVLAAGYTPSNSSCDSLSTVNITLQGDSSYLTWYILVTFPSPHEDIDWVHVGEVRFLNGPIDGQPLSRYTSELTPGEILS